MSFGLFLDCAGCEREADEGNEGEEEHMQG